ncbi:putative nuclease HARBI1 [Sceloporus undulatus]|uniref:putative nuclease HARBI1 n=1 Tax=Sceloporus undulatus TaxID=8520 RepID=UPI001C4B69DD|nr:putative nuclease HARBI1 [Sceloporus undulatus]
MDAFGRRGFPQVVGLRDGCHCLIIPPLGQRNANVTRKGSYSVILQGTSCDHTGRFVDVELGWHGSVHDATVARNSLIFEAIEAGIYVEGNPNIRGQQIGPLILADCAYPIRKWLMTPFKTPHTPKEKLFNKKLNHVRGGRGEIVWQIEGLMALSHCPTPGGRERGAHPRIMRHSAQHLRPRAGSWMRGRDIGAVLCCPPWKQSQRMKRLPRRKKGRL